MANKNEKKGSGKKAGIIAFGATLLGYALIFPFHRLIHFIIGGALAFGVGKLVETMATPMKGLDKAKNSPREVTADEIPDEYARGIVQAGIENMNKLRIARDAVNEYVFTRRVNALSVNFRKLLEAVQQDPGKASRLRKLNTYYLPTCIKLLNSYKDAKAQGTSYMTISSTREDILATLDKLLEATQSLYDNMVKDDLTDMDIEIDVLEQMLKNDGMIENDLTQGMKESAHAAARQQSAKPVAAPVKPAVQPAKPAAAPVKPAVQPAKPAAAPVKPAEEPVREPVPVMKDEAPKAAADRTTTPVPTIQVEGGTATAQVLQQGAPILQMPDAPVNEPWIRHDSHSAN